MAYKIGLKNLTAWKFLSELRKPRFAFMLLLGIMSGAPLFLVYTTLSAWLYDSGVSRADIGYFSWVGLAFAFKFLWSPALDRLPVPGLESWLGRRKAWILVSQLGVICSILWMSVSNPATHLSMIALSASATAFFAATQDVAIDAWRLENAPDSEQGLMAAGYRIGYRLAYYGTVAGAFILADIISWNSIYAGIACIFALLACLIALKAPATRLKPLSRETNTGFKKKLQTAFFLPLSDFWQRYGYVFLLALALVCTYRVTDFVMGVMATPFYLDLGFSKTEIGASVKTFGPIFTLIGASVAAFFHMRFGKKTALIAGAFLGGGSNLAYAALASFALQAGETPLSFLMTALAVENFSDGFAGTVLIVFMSSLVNRHFSATQYALLSSLYALPSKFLAGFSGKLVESLVIAPYGILSAYAPFFTITAIMGLPAVCFACLWAHYGFDSTPEDDPSQQKT